MCRIKMPKGVKGEPFKGGMTLVELMVSLVILMLVLGAVYSILNIQQTRATQVGRTTIMQTDAQVAFTLVKWDLLLAGLGYPYSQQDAVQLLQVDGINGAGIGLKAVGLGFEMNRAHWSYLVASADGPDIYVRRWADTLANFENGDTIVILDALRNPIGGYENLVITNDPRHDTLWYVDSLWGDSIPASRINVGISVSVPQGSMIFKRNSGIYYGGLTYTVSNDTLKRGTEALLNNVEAIVFRYGIDTDGDRIIDTWTDRNNPPFNPSYDNTWAISFNMVVVSDPIPNFDYGNVVTLEDYPGHTYSYDLTTPMQRRRRRAILSTVVYPQNLQPGERF